MIERSQVVDGLRLAYLEGGDGAPVVLLHGNPTSGYLWRGVVPALEGLGRVVVPDLAGMGRSAKVPGGGDAAYRFVEHRRYLEGLLDAVLGDEAAVLVGHDWGAVLLVDWARRHSGRARGIAYLETLVAPVRSGSPNEPAPEVFGPLRGPDGERLALEEDLLVEVVLPAGTMRPLLPTETAAYRAPFAEPGEGRRPTLTWAREIPIDGSPADVHEVVAANAAFMASTRIPKLFVNGEPGALLVGPLRDLCRTWPEQTEVTVPGLHFLPEDSPEAIGAALAAWIVGLPSRGQVDGASGPSASASS